VPVGSPGSPHFTREPENPTLAAATQAALIRLNANPKGFFLMVEQGDIDWANHYNDYNWMIGSVHDLDEAVKAAIDFVNQPRDDIDWSNTLILVTADHCNGYMRIVDPSKLTAGVLPEQVGTAYHYSYPGGEVTYGLTGHTNELVMLYAEGSGAGLFEQAEGKRYLYTKIIDNTDIYRIMVEATGMK
jgi:alkaline phosphatase